MPTSVEFEIRWRMESVMGLPPENGSWPFPMTQQSNSHSHSHTGGLRAGTRPPWLPEFQAHARPVAESPSPSPDLVQPSTAAMAPPPPPDA